MVPDAATAVSGGPLLYYRCAPFSILKPKNRILLWVFSALLVLSDLFPFFWIFVALYVAWVCFGWVALFSVRTFFLNVL